MAISESLLKEAMNLKAHEKMLFIEALIKNLDNTNPELNAIWVDESFKRLRKHEKGLSKSYTYEEIFG